MTWFLRQSTASQEVLLGPFVDSADGVTAETSLSIANTDIKIHKAGATTLVNKNSGGATHISNGNYYAVLNATDTNTLGSGAIIVQVSGALPFRLPFTVLPANIFDSMIAGSDTFDVQVTGIGSGVITATSIASNAITSAKIAANAIGSSQLASDAIGAAQVAADAIGASELAADAVTEIVEALLKYDLSSISGEASRSVLNALRVLRNRVEIAASTLTVFEEDDATTAWTAAVTTSAGNPISEIDPT